MSNTIFGTMYIVEFPSISLIQIFKVVGFYTNFWIQFVKVVEFWTSLLDITGLKKDSKLKIASTLMMSQLFVKIHLKPNLLSSQKWFALRNILKYFFLSSISDPNDCSTMPFSMSNKHNETSEFKAGCPGAVSG